MDQKVWRHFDFVLLGTTLLLIGIGVAMIYSATLGTPDPELSDLVRRQSLYALAGLGLMLLVAALDYRFLETLQKPLYLLTIFFLLVVFILGQLTHGVRRWLGAGAIQPSEVAKILVIITLAKYLADHEEDLHHFRYILFSLVFAGIPAVLIYLQPALGTAVVLAVVWLVMVLMAGVRPLHLALLSILGALGAPLFWMSLKDYMRRRILTFLDPLGDPLGAGYNVNQARIAIGSGGWLGQGFTSGSQSQLHFLRVRHTDFIFSVMGEELGLVGALVLLVLFIVVLWRILRAASMARDTYGRLIACGVAAMLFFQTAVNISVNLGLMPTSGIPLPFISYGGSSLITFLVAEGLVQSVVMRHRKIEF